MIATVAFRNFKALRATGVDLGPFNLVIGPNGSGKTSLIEALLRLSALARHPPSAAESGPTAKDAACASHAPEIEYRFRPPHDDIIARVAYEREGRGRLQIEPARAASWPALQRELLSVRGYVLDHKAMAKPAPAKAGGELRSNGANLAAVLAEIRRRSPESFSRLAAEMLRVAPEFHSIELAERTGGSIEFGLRLADNGLVTAAEMSQGMLYLVAMFALAFTPEPPRILCIEDVDRGIHPRLLREVRDALYRLSHPAAFGMKREPVQVVATTHSPYFIDLFREHPEEVIISQKQGRAARFERLVDRPDLSDLLREGSLGDMWYSGILGGVPEEP